MAASDFLQAPSRARAPRPVSVFEYIKRRRNQFTGKQATYDQQLVNSRAACSPFPTESNFLN
jgi:hypothetical protein